MIPSLKNKKCSLIFICLILISFIYRCTAEAEAESKIENVSSNSKSKKTFSKEEQEIINLTIPLAKLERIINRFTFELTNEENKINNLRLELLNKEASQINNVTVPAPPDLVSTTEEIQISKVENNNSMSKITKISEPPIIILAEEESQNINSTIQAPAAEAAASESSLSLQSTPNKESELKNLTATTETIIEIKRTTIIPPLIIKEDLNEINNFTKPSPKEESIIKNFTIELTKEVTKLNTTQVQKSVKAEIKRVLKSTTELTKEEKVALAKFRELTKDLLENHDEYYHTEIFMMRWLKARGMDPIAANKMIREADQWRRANKIDNIIEENFFDFPIAPYTYSGHDNEGRPLVLMTPTSIDLRRLLLSGKRAAVIRNWDKMLEQGYHEVKNVTKPMSNGEEVSQIVAILDVQGFNIRQHFCLQCAGVYVEWVQHFENYYPDSLKYFILINMNRLAVPFVELLRPFFSPATRQALRVFGTYKPEWQKFLLSIIPADQLPYRFGGTKP